MLVLLVILILLWTVWGTAAVLAALSVRKFLRRFDHRRRETFAGYRPPAAVVVPFRGVDLDLDAALANLCTQDYPDYRLVCVVESTQDPAYAVLRTHLARHDCRWELLVAGEAARTEGQKVHNLLYAIERMQTGGEANEVWVFADSDAAPGPHWLGELVGPLYRDQLTGITTGYRWMVPPENAGFFRHFWSHVASVLNSTVACFYGYERFNHAWGGSMAMRRRTALEAGLVDYLRGSLSDDYQATRMCRDLGKNVYFVPRCLVASPVDYGLRTFLRFARRQYVITRTHAPWIYYRALAVQAVFFSGYVTALGAIAWALLRGPAWAAVLPAAALSVVFVANQIRANYRRRVVRRAFGDAMLTRLRHALWLDRWATPVWMALHLLVMLAALVSRTIRWRGRRYRIDRPQSVTQLSS